MPTNWLDRVGAVGRGLLRFGAALCARKPSSRRSENHCIDRKSFESPEGALHRKSHRIGKTYDLHDAGTCRVGAISALMAEELTCRSSHRKPSFSYKLSPLALGFTHTRTLKRNPQHMAKTTTIIATSSLLLRLDGLLARADESKILG